MHNEAQNSYSYIHYTFTSRLILIQTERRLLNQIFPKQTLKLTSNNIRVSVLDNVVRGGDVCLADLRPWHAVIDLDEFLLLDSRLYFGHRPLK